MHEHDQRTVPRDIVGNRGPVVPLQRSVARHPGHARDRRLRAPSPPARTSWAARISTTRRTPPALYAAHERSGASPGGPIAFRREHGRVAERLNAPVLKNAGKLIRRLGEQIGLPHLNPHALRHAFVTLSLDEGASLRDVQDAARHADPRTTRRYDKNRNSLNRHPTHRLLGALEP